MNNVRIAGWWIVAAVIGVLLLFGSRLVAMTVDWLWFGEMGQRALFWTLLAAQAQLALLFGVPLFAVFSDAYMRRMSGSNACAATLFGRTVDVKFRPICEERELI